MRLAAIALPVAVVALAAAATSRPAVAAACWQQLVNDSYDGNVDAGYPLGCYSTALRHLPCHAYANAACHDLGQRLEKAVAALHRRGQAIRASTIIPPGGFAAQPPARNGYGERVRIGAIVALLLALSAWVWIRVRTRRRGR